jgi:hypothetical protein
LPIKYIVDATELPPTRLAAGTVVTADYLPWVRVTAASFLEQHPDAKFAVLVADDPGAEQLRADDHFYVVRPADVGLTKSELDWMQLIYSPLELCCALKPWLLRRLLDSTDVAFYIDADICVYAPLTEAASEAGSVGLVLSPHSLAPRRDPNLPDDDALLQFGQFNGGFMAVSAAGRPFVDWWAERCARECTDWNPESPRRYLDQRWLDLAIGYFPTSVSRDPGINLARWNLFQRDLELVDGRYVVDGGPLRCFHFSAFDPLDPEKMWRHGYTHPKVDPARSPPLRSLLADYATRLLAAGWQPSSGARPPRQVAGIELTPQVRNAVRTALIDAERLGVAPVNAAADPLRLTSWLRAPVSAGGLSWYLWGLRRTHPSIATGFPQVPGPDELRYINWASGEGVSAGLVPTSLAGPATPFSLNGARSFVALVEVDEALADPSLLAGIADVFTSSDDVTFVLRAAGQDPAAVVPALQSALAAYGLEGPHTPDLLAVLDPVPAVLLAPRVNAILTHRPGTAAFSAPVVTTAEALRGAI